MAFQTTLSDATGTRDVAAGASQKGIAALGVRRDADTTITEADGDLTLPTVDSTGRTKVSTTGHVFPVTTQSLTASGTSVVVDVSRASNVTIHVKGGATAGVGGGFSFEASVDSTNGTDGTWFPVQVARTNANTIETTSGTIGLAINTGLAYAWEASVNAYLWFRVRATTLTSGIYAWTIVRGAFATEPVPAIGAHPVTGSGNFAVTNTLLATGATGLGKGEDGAHATGDIGTMALGVRNDNAVTDATSANGDYGYLAVDIKGAQFVEQRPHSFAALTNVTSSATNVTILAANANRRGATIYNDSTQVLYLKFGATASATSFTIKLGPDIYYEVPFGYNGIIDGIWASANGNARVTEVTG